MKKRALSLILALVMVCGLLPTAAGAAFTTTRTYKNGQFTDVADSAWFAKDVKKVYELGLMNGNSATTFNPKGMFTVAEALTVAGRMHHLANGGSGTLPKVSGVWYQGAVNYCLAQGIITKGQFDSYTRNATRAEMAGVVRAALPDDQWKAINSVSALPDVNMGNEYAQAIFDLYNAGVFTGSDKYGMFQPYANITRAEVAAIVARCADPAQRKTLNLKPLSERQAPELLGGYYNNAEMSNGRLRYQDPATKKWGYLDGNGTAVIPAQYDKAEDFEAGYAKVQKNGKWGLVNTAGTMVLPVEQDEITRAYTLSGTIRFDPLIWVATKGGKTALVNAGKLVTDYEYKATYTPLSPSTDLYKVSRDKSGVVTSSGKVVLPRQFWGITWNGVYFRCNTKTASFQSDRYDIYDRNGVKLLSDLDYVYMKDNNPLLAVKEGEKYAVAVGGKKITEAVYDSVELAVNSPYAEVKYGNLTGLVGMSGELFAPGTYDEYAFSGDYFAAQKKGSGNQPSEVVVGDTTGVLHTGEYNWGLNHGSFWLNVLDAGGFYCRMDSISTFSRGMLFTEDGQSRKVQQNSHLGFHWEDDDGEYLLTSTGKVLGPRSHYSDDLYYYDYRIWEEEDGKYGEYFYGIWDETGELSGPIYTSDVEAVKAYREYRASQPENKEYAIRQSDAGKPIVCYGNDTTGWTPVIEFYKNNMYYDEIEKLGEGYYACRFNTTWYLLHA